MRQSQSVYRCCAYRASRRQVFRDRAPLTGGRENVHQAVHPPPHDHRALATASLAGGISGSTSPHSSSVRSLGYRNLLQPAFGAWIRASISGVSPRRFPRSTTYDVFGQPASSPDAHKTACQSDDARPQGPPGRGRGRAGSQPPRGDGGCCAQMDRSRAGCSAKQSGSMLASRLSSVLAGSPAMPLCRCDRLRAARGARCIGREGPP
jgi:hypothetical protein